MTDILELSSDELIQLSLLRDEETDLLVSNGHLKEEQRWDSPLASAVTLDYEEMTLVITPGPIYPLAPPTWEIVNYTMPIDPVDGLRRRLRQLIVEAAETNNPRRFRAWVEACDGSLFDYVKVVLLMAKETCQALAGFRADRARKMPIKRIDPSPPSLAFKLKDSVDIQSLSSSELAYRYIGKTPQEIAAIIPPRYRVQHIEEVIRKDLAIKFDRCHTRLRNELSQLPLRTLRPHAPPAMCRSTRVADYVDYISKPRLTFHGTQRQYVPNIVRHGFLRPGTRDPSSGVQHLSRCGATYGRGIYSSPDPSFSLAYSDWWCTATQPDEYFGLKMIVCATLMGRSRVMYREDNWRTQDEPYEGADSHVGNNSLEYIVFDTAQILPVYVIHLDWGDDNAAFFADIPEDPGHWGRRSSSKHHRLNDNEVQYAGDKQRAKAAVFAKAAKYFPYGFGPATGSKFEVLEVGEVSEDDEDYGEYQELRGERNHGVESNGYWSWQKMGELEDRGGAATVPADEYSAQRTEFGPAWDQIALPGEETLAEDVEDEGYEFHLGRLMGILDD